ncbi:MAG: vanadium-dependent haloperoxidase [Bacteroidota bacterium]
MKFQLKKYFLLVIIVQSSFAARGEANHHDAGPLHRAHKVLTNIIIHDIFSPPVSSRIYMYAHVAAYETLVKGNPNYRSLFGQIPTFPQIPDAEQEVSYDLAAVHAFLLTGKSLIFSEQMLEDSIQKILPSITKTLTPKLAEASLAYGKKISDIIVAWSKQDGYGHTRKLKRYSFKKDEGKWKPTPPMYMAAVEPHWRLMRTLALDSPAQYKPSPPATFSKEQNSEFYKLANYVYITVKNLTQEQKSIANFWDCNPFAVNVHGHINYATKKLSPGGHWLSIAALASQKVNADITKSSAAYTLTAIALYDGFISCWDEKYRSNLIRPESYINAYIDETWKPLLQTPPFPEYTSGHSVISTASATVLSSFFGNEFAFVDTSEVEYGLGTRSFSSFTEACNEAAISRLYGGIHYLPAIEQGQLQGKKVGEMVLSKIRLLR